MPKNNLAYCKSHGFRLEANPDKQNKTVKIFKMVGSKKMQNSDYEYEKTHKQMRHPDIDRNLTDEDCREAAIKREEILVAESLNHDAPNNRDINLKIDNSHFYDPGIYSNFIVPESKERYPVVNIYKKDEVDCKGGVTDKCNKNPYLSGGKKSRRKTRRSKKSHRKSSKKQRKSRRGGKSRRGRR